MIGGIIVSVLVHQTLTYFMSRLGYTLFGTSQESVNIHRHLSDGFKETNANIYQNEMVTQDRFK